MQVKCVCLFHRIFAILFMKYHNFYTFCLNFMEIDGKAGGFCGGRASPATPSRRRAGPCPAARAVRTTPRPPRAALFAGNPAHSLAAHAAKIGLAGLPGAVLCGCPRTPPRRPLCGEPRTPPRRSRCQNWLAGVPVPLTPRETSHPPPLRTLIFSLLALAGVAVQLTCRDNFVAIFLTTYRIIVVLS